MTDFQKLKIELETELAALTKKADPIRTELDKLKEQILPVEMKIRTLHNQLKEIEQPHKAELVMKIAAIDDVLKNFPSPVAETIDHK